MAGDAMVGLRWPEGVDLAEHVVISHYDISCAGLRAALLLREGIGGQRSSWEGTILSSDDEGEVVQCQTAWGHKSGASRSALQVDTFTQDGGLRFSIICINSQLELADSTAVSWDLAKALLLHKVRRITVLAALKFNPAATDAAKVHVLHLPSDNAAAATEVFKDFVTFDRSLPVEDGFLSSLLQVEPIEVPLQRISHLRPIPVSVAHDNTRMFMESRRKPHGSDGEGRLTVQLS
mmetsp:Transcript_39910/g.62250  ORF Transcript_39910/g.62250 Transcript_39910/m.62250 type:complete len:235 (-) Transcript_39910:341-1045(-)